LDADSRSEPALTGATLAAASGFDLDLATSAVLVFDQGLVPAKARSRRHRRSSHPFRSVGSLSNGVDIVVAPGPGSPVAAVTVEFLAAFGVTRLISVGTAGRLVPDGPSTRVVGQAVSDEGTSCHYGDDLRPDQDLLAALLTEQGGSAGVALTTDVPFRQTPRRLRSHSEVADLIEMECAAIFSSARAFNIRAGAILVVSDTFGRHDWTRSDPAETLTALGRAVEVSAKVLAQGS